MKLFDVYPLFDIEIVKGKGCYTYDSKGNEYLDLYGGHAVISVGHTHPYYTQKLTEQAQKLIFYSNSVINSLQIELADKLGAIRIRRLFAVSDQFRCRSKRKCSQTCLFPHRKKESHRFQKSFPRTYVGSGKSNGQP